MSRPTPYAATNEAVPHAKREVINRGILNLIRTGQKPDPARVFAGYTGKGGLHGLSYKDFSSRHEYSEAKRVIEQGQFFTPDWVVELIANFLDVPNGETVADLTCGAGAFANHFLAQRFYGLEIDSDAVTVARYLYPKAEIAEGDIRGWAPFARFRFIVGNPPFACRWSLPRCPMANEAGEAASEDVFLWKSRDAVAAGGSLCFVAPATWLNDDIRDAKALAFVRDSFQRVSEVLLPQDAFASVGVDSFATKIVLLRRWLPHEAAVATMPVVVDGRAMARGAIVPAWRAACSEYASFRRGLGQQRAALVFADQCEARLAKAARVATEHRFWRLHSELVRQDPLRARVVAQVWADAGAPARYDKDGSRLPQPTVESAFREVRKALREVDEQPRHLVRIIRTKRGICAKSYSRPAALAITEAHFSVDVGSVADGRVSLAQIEEMVARVRNAVRERNQRCDKKDGRAVRVEFEGLAVRRWVARLQRRFNVWSRPLTENSEAVSTASAHVRGYYQSLAPYGIEVKDRQVDELGRVAAKPGALLAWEMGGGKSLAALAWDSFKVGNRGETWTLLVSSALAIEMHWKEQLDVYRIAWQQPDSRDGWRLLTMPRDGAGQHILLATHHQIGRYSKVIRGLVRQGIIQRLIVDESDEFGSRTARRTQGLNVAGREIEQKLLLTGTPVRNHAGELFSQLSLLLHGEPFFRCIGKTQVVYDARVRDFIEIPNDERLKPYVGPGSFALFRRCHAPVKPTVMGAERSLPALPNREEMEAFLRCFRSRLRLRDLLTHEPFVRDTVAVILPGPERAQYDSIAKSAVEIARAHLSASRSDRRATMLSLAQAIRLMQQASSMPGRFGLSGIGAKQATVLDLIRRSHASHIAVGVLWRAAVADLLPLLKEAFPDRVVIAFDGEDSFALRRRKLADLAAAPKGILLTTQQSNRSSLNLPIVSEVIAEALPWNMTSLNQWAMRFCRLTSRATVQVNLLVAEGTIEERILGLLLRKQTVALPVAGDDIREEEELFGEYGIVPDDLDELARYLAEYEPTLRRAAA